MSRNSVQGRPAFSSRGSQSPPSPPPTRGCPAATLQSAAAFSIRRKYVYSSLSSHTRTREGSGERVAYWAAFADGPRARAAGQHGRTRKWPQQEGRRAARTTGGRRGASFVPPLAVERGDDTSARRPRQRLGPAGRAEAGAPPIRGAEARATPTRPRANGPRSSDLPTRSR